MCYAVYIGSAVKIENSTPFNENNPGIYLISKKDEPIKDKFTNSFIYYIESHTGCSCGFFTDSRYEQDQEDCEQAERCRNELWTLIRNLLGKSIEVELCICWEGQQYKKPKNNVTVLSNPFLDSFLSFSELDFITIKQ